MEVGPGGRGPKGIPKRHASHVLVSDETCRLEAAVCDAEICMGPTEQNAFRNEKKGPPERLHYGTAGRKFNHSRGKHQKKKQTTKWGTRFRIIDEIVVTSRPSPPPSSRTVSLQKSSSATIGDWGRGSTLFSPNVQAFFGESSGF